ncbi:exo-alpha-sialidase [Niabella terrae]
MRFFLTVILSVFVLLTSQGQSILDQRIYSIPVVKGKPFTSLIRITLPEYSDGQKHFLKEVGLAFGQATNLEDIQDLMIFLNADSNYLSDEKVAKAALFGTWHFISETNRIGQISGNIRLNPGTNFLWIGLSVKPGAPVGRQLHLLVNNLKIDNRKFLLPETAFASYRIAVALRKANQDNVHTSRIPGLATAKNGDLLAIFDARYQSARDLQGDIDIGLVRSQDKGNTWLPLQIVLDQGRWGGLPEKFNGVSDACILVDQNSGNIFIAGLWMHGVLDKNGRWVKNLSDSSTNWNHQWKAKGSQPGYDPRETAQFLMTKSADHGATWSAPVNLTRMCKKQDWWLWAPAPGRGITLADGSLVFPTQGRGKDGKAFSNITYSRDGGRTWHTSRPATSINTTEATVIQRGDGSLMLNMRTSANKGRSGPGNGRAISVTYNMGASWMEHPGSRRDLPEPVCMASLHRHVYTAAKGQKKDLLLFVNPNSTTKRNHITLKVSLDDGESWPAEKFIELDELGGRGYSCITSIDNETIGIVYEGSQAQLIFEKISIREILN